MHWLPSEQLRIAHMEACRELSDRARSQVSTYGESHRRGGELVEHALRLAAGAEDALRLAVAAERAAGVSWETIGQQFYDPDSDDQGISRQAAQKRFGAIVDELRTGVLFPKREPAYPGGLGTWACPDGLDDPDRTLADLDEWALRHREPTDPDRGAQPASQKVRRPEERRRVETIGLVTELASRVADRKLPRGVSERAASRMVLEAKVRAYDVMRDSPVTGARERDEARTLANDAFDQLVAWHREDLEPRTTIDVDEHVGSLGDGHMVRVDGRPVRALSFTAEGRPDDTGWFLWRVDAEAYERDPACVLSWVGDGWPLEVAGVDVDALLEHRGDRAALLARARDVAASSTRTATTAAVRSVVDDHAHEAARIATAPDGTPSARSATRWLP